MFIYLSKKIAIPNNVALKCISWNKQKGYIACGGKDGLLKVLKLESQSDGEVRGLAAPSSLSMNQTLEGHSDAVQVVMWNEQHAKLTTSDVNGLIIVWMLHKGSWFEEMINNRQKSVVKSMGWNRQGELICIVYEDGGVIVGTVDGNRVWGKELKQSLTHVEWSPDSKHLLFAMASGEVHIYDAQGNFMSKVETDFFSPLGPVAALTWYNGNGGSPSESANSLAICYQSGKCQIMKHHMDDEPFLIDTNMTIVCADWNHNGSCLAIAGKQTPNSAEGDQKKAASANSNVIQFFSHNGEHLRSLRVPGNSIESCSWEGGGLRIALAVDSHIYFANIRPKYKWGYCSNTVVYEFTDASGATQVAFWDVKNMELHKKKLPSSTPLLLIAAEGEYCCMALKQGSGAGGVGVAMDSARREEYMLVLYNSIGTPLESKTIYFEPVFMCMTGSLVIVANKDVFYAWQFTDPIKLMSADVSLQASKNQLKEWLIHIDNPMRGVGASSDQSSSIQNVMVTFDSWAKADKESSDPICAIAASEKVLLAARSSGTVNVYSLPKMSFNNKLQTDIRAYNLYINCNSTRCCVLDISGVLAMWDMEATNIDAAGNEVLGKQLELERKDVWDVCWSKDDPALLALMEKTRMYIVRDSEPEEPVQSSGYLCSFDNLQVRSVLLDEVLMSPEQCRKDNVIDREARSLRDLREMVGKISLEDTKQYIQDNPHPRLWNLLGEKALEQLDLEVAETAMVQCKDYPGIQFVKRIKLLQNDTLKKAEVEAYLNRFDQADKLYYEMDRKDLAVELRQKLGDWVRVVQLLKAGSDGGDDTRLEYAYNAIGDYYADRQHWSKAVVYYSQGRNQEKLADCYYSLEDFENLSKMASYLSENHPLLPKIAEMFVSVGMSGEAVDAFKKCGRISEAIDCCIMLNQWDAVIELAKQSNSRDIDNMLARYATQLIDKGRIVAAVELYKKAGDYIQAAKKLFEIAKEETAKKSSPLRIKKIYVLAGKLVEMHRDKSMGTKYKSKNSDALSGLLDDNTTFSANDSRILDNAWRGAEAFHFYVLAQRQFYAEKTEAAMRTCMQLVDYEDYLDPLAIYSLLALSAIRCRSFDVASRAFGKLEELGGTQEEREEFEQLAETIFIRHPPKSKASLDRDTCLNCGEASLYKWCPLCHMEPMTSAQQTTAR
ncbi:WD repeat-containing protein 35-like [Convolutriloba macropyga]|uniref:WD repeat-containing protein 35-like n=1 Tax=Convolutriloba macropyga TaxID=536237 RepID=UPI003F528B70